MDRMTSRLSLWRRARLHRTQMMMASFHAEMVCILLDLSNCLLCCSSLLPCICTERFVQQYQPQYQRHSMTRMILFVLAHEGQQNRTSCYSCFIEAHWISWMTTDCFSADRADSLGWYGWIVEIQAILANFRQWVELPGSHNHSHYWKWGAIPRFCNRSGKHVPFPPAWPVPDVNCLLQDHDHDLQREAYNYDFIRDACSFCAQLQTNGKVKNRITV